MDPPPHVAVSPFPRSSGEKSDQNTTPRQEENEPRDTAPKSKTVLVPQTKSLTVMEKEGNVFRCFKTRKDTILPTFDRWRPAIHERFLLHTHHSSRDIEAWKSKFSSLESDLRSSTDTKLKLEDQIDNLFSELMKSNGELQDQYQRYDKLQEELSNARSRLLESESYMILVRNQSQFRHLEDLE
ncbi:hypothetical protein AtEden1_Chr3g0192071 [Arabidopsis thaliana]